jgi:hypothetical protein
VSSRLKAGAGVPNGSIFEGVAAMASLLSRINLLEFKQIFLCVLRVSVVDFLAKDAKILLLTAP